MIVRSQERGSELSGLNQRMSGSLLSLCTHRPPTSAFIPFLCQSVPFTTTRIHLLSTYCVPGFTYVIPLDLQNSLIPCGHVPTSVLQTRTWDLERWTWQVNGRASCDGCLGPKPVPSSLLWSFTGPTLSYLTTPSNASPNRVNKLQTTVMYTRLKISSTCFVFVGLLNQHLKV